MGWRWGLRTGCHDDNIWQWLHLRWLLRHPWPASVFLIGPLGLAPQKTCWNMHQWVLWSDVDITVSHHLMCLIFFFIHRPRFVLYNVITRTQCPLSYLSFILSYVQLMVPTPRLLLSCSVVLFCLTLGYSLLFLGVGGLHMPLFHQ